MSHIEFKNVNEGTLQLNDSNIFIINEDNKCNVIYKSDDCVSVDSIFTNVVDAMNFAESLYNVLKWGE